jgi:hypothetical protein
MYISVSYISMEFWGQGTDGSRCLLKNQLLKKYFIDLTHTELQIRCQNLAILLETKIFKMSITKKILLKYIP